MGQFSWLDCKDNKKAVLDNVHADVYLLIPATFGGGHHHEACYDGYGRFDGCDVYEEVATWNRHEDVAHLIEKPTLEQYGGNEQYFNRAIERYNYSMQRFQDFASGTVDNWGMESKYGEYWLREIGIDIACYDEQNAALPYPIKITHDANAVYEDCEPSPADPCQGWGE